MKKPFTKTIWLLSLVSLFTDMASELLYPVMPIYLKSIGFSILLIGVLEGVAEATAGISKGYFGKLSDDIGRRLPFVQIGYGLSAIAKPMMALWIAPIWIFLARALDRFGKGIRTGARDALLSDETTTENKGKVFGFHRSMDTAGAVLGPSLALIYLYFYPENYKTLFLIAFIPGLLAIFCTFLLKENQKAIPKPKMTSNKVFSFFAFLNYWKNSPQKYRQIVCGFLIFALFNSSDAFLLLKIKEAGLSDTWVIGIYIFYNLAYALLAYPVGIWADKVGMKASFVIGMFLFAVVYLVIPFVTDFWIFLLLFWIYGMYAAFTEGITKAWISNLSDKKDTATAIGTYATFQSICMMISSALAGVIWVSMGATTTFMISGITAIGVGIYFWWKG
jgi:MFS family permease